nr:IS5/IS1182 family transposase [uncultured bacterium]
MTNKKKRQYRIRNWVDYNKALVRRGSLTLWLDAHSTDTWLSVEKAVRRGRARTYTDVAILCSLLLREVYHLPLRATQGLVGSLLRLLEVKLPAPDYSTLSRRARSLHLSLCAHNHKQIKHLVIDSTGLKLYGEGEWRVRQHGWAKHRTWRKLHLAMDANSHEVTAALLTSKDVVDPRVLPRLLKQIEVPVERVYADGAYDARECYQAIYGRGARAVIPPRKGSVLWADDYLHDRNSNLRQVGKLGSKGWKRKVKYHRRSLVETAIFRLKTLFSDKLRSREVERQRTEVMIRCLTLNRMTELGMPQSYAT